MLDLADLTFLLHFDREMRSFYCSDGKSDGDEESIKQRALGNNDVGSVYHGEQREKPKQQRTTTPIAERFVARQNLRRKHNRGDDCIAGEGVRFVPLRCSAWPVIWQAQVLLATWFRDVPVQVPRRHRRVDPHLWPLHPIYLAVLRRARHD